MKKMICIFLSFLLLLGAVPVSVSALNDPVIPLDDLDLWLTADEGVTQSGGSVTGWKSQAADTISLAAAGSNQAVTLKKDAEAGYSYLQFDGSGSLTGETNNYSGKDAITLILVSQYEGIEPTTGANGDANAALYWKESIGWGAMSLAPYNTHVQMRFGIGNASGVSRYSRRPVGGLSSSVAMKDGGAHSLIINNEEVLKETGKAEKTFDIEKMMYVGQGAGQDSYFTGKIAEVLVYDRVLTSAELDQINGYFAEKYGIEMVSKTPSLLITPPNKQEYNVGESLDTTGMTVEMKYANGGILPVEAEDYVISDAKNDDISGFKLKGKRYITVSLKSDPAIKGGFYVTVGDSLEIKSAVAAPISVPYGTAKEQLILPFGVDAELDGYFSNVTQPTPSKLTKVPVEWDTSTFNVDLLNTPQKITGTLNLTLGKTTENETTKTKFPIGNPKEVKAEIEVTVRAAEKEIYVSPTAPANGNGTKDAPFSSINDAKDAIRENGWNKDMRGDILVWLAGGTYRISEPIEFGPEDSGSNGFSIIYQAIPGEVPNLNGGTVVDEWQRWDEIPGVYVATVNRDKKLRNLFVNGEAASMTSTTANTCGPYGKVTITGEEPWAVDAGVEAAGALLNWEEIGFDAESPAELTNPEDIEIRQEKIWNEVTVGISEIKTVDPGDDGGAPPPKSSSTAPNMGTEPGNIEGLEKELDRIINNPEYIARRNQGDTAFILQQPYGAIAASLSWQCGFMPYFAELGFGGNKVGENIRQNFVVQNSLELLRNPGEFYFDKTGKKLYYYPKDGENIHLSEVVVPVSEGLIRIHGQNLSNRVENLQFSGIKFTYDDKGLEVVENSEGFASVQNMGAYTKYASNGDWHGWLYNITDIPKGTVDVENAKGIVFSGNAFTTLSSSTCIGYVNDVTESRITGNLFMNTAGNSASIGHPQHVHIGEAAPPDTWQYEKYPANVEGVCKDIIVSNNHIENPCTMFTQADALTAFFVENVEFSHNEIKNVPYAAMNFGWGWQNQDDRADYYGTRYPDYPSKTARKNVIAYNEIRKTNQTLPEDGGALYVLGQQEDSIMAYNSSHGEYYSRWGERSIYFDEGSAHFEAFDNEINHLYTNGAHSILWYNKHSNSSDRYKGPGIAWRPPLTTGGGGIDKSLAGTSFDTEGLSSDEIKEGAGVSDAYKNDIEDLKKLITTAQPGEQVLFYDFEDQDLGSVNSQNNTQIAPFDSGGLSIVDDNGNKVVRVSAGAGSTGHHGFYLKDISWKNALIQVDFKYNEDQKFIHGWEALSIQGFAQASDLDALANKENLFAGAFFDSSNQYKYHVNKGEAGAHIGGEAVPFTVEKETWYSVKIMVKDSKYYTKVWSKGGEEPLEWQLSGDVPKEVEGENKKGTLRVKTYKRNTDSLIDMSFDNIKVDTIKGTYWGDFYSITIDEKISNGSVVVNKNHNLPAGEQVTITATPDEGYTTQQILIDGSPVEFEDDKTIFEITKDITVSAVFAQDFKLTSGGVAIESIVPGDNIAVSASLPPNDDGRPQWMYVGIYDASDKLTAVKSIDGRSGENELIEFHLSIEVPSNAEGALRLKAFVWDSANRPIRPAFSFPN